MLEQRRVRLLMRLLLARRLVVCLVVLVGLLLVLVVLLVLLLLVDGHGGRSEGRLPGGRAHLARQRMLAGAAYLVAVLVQVVVRLLRGLILVVVVVVVLRLLADRRRERALPGGAICLGLHLACLFAKCVLLRSSR